MLFSKFMILTLLTLPSFSYGSLKSTSIIGGTTANLRDYPWQVSLRNSFGHFCGGSIVSKRHILTSAHCIYDGGTTSIGAFAGGDGKQTNLRLIGSPYSSKIIYHPDYKKTHPNFLTRISDLALLEYSKDFDLADDVRIIPLAKNLNDVTPLQTKLAATGWGIDKPVPRGTSTSVDSSMLPNQLRRITNYVVGPREKTAQFWKDINLSDGFINMLFLYPGTSHIVIRTSNQEENTCFGDSGGPLVFFKTPNLKEEAQLYGVTSSGWPTAASECLYGLTISTSVPYHYDWIYENIKDAL